ncbi:hypothetical protein BROUX41_003638 [Berkeleyomyces rouxiae]
MKDEMKDTIVTPFFFDMFAQVEKGSVNPALYAKRVEHDFKKREATKVRRNLDHLAHNYHLRSGDALNIEDARSMVNNLELEEAERAAKAHESLEESGETGK